MTLTRRDALAGVLLPFLPIRLRAAPSVSLVIGTGVPGHSAVSYTHLTLPTILRV